MAEGVRAVAALEDPVGEELEHRTLASGIDLRKVRVPLGVVAVVYEARPNVTIDCAALTIKSGNAIVLRGSSYAERSNGALAAVVREALAEAGLPEDAVLLLAGGGREELAELATQDGLVDLLDPARRRGAEGGAQGRRDGAGDVRRGRQLPRLRARRRRPGDGAADRRTTRRCSVPASATRPRRCWSTRRSPRTSCPACSPTCARPGSSWSATSARASWPAGSRSGSPADADWDTEYLDLKMAVGVVDSLDEAIDHINGHGTGHSEAIVTSSEEAAERFSRRGRRRRRLHQRLDPLHRRLRVRDGGRDRQLDPEAARARADRAARADDLQVRRPRRRPGA